MLTTEADFLVLLIFLIRVVSLHFGSFLQFLVFSKFLNICKAPLNHRETALDKCTIIIIIIIYKTESLILLHETAYLQCFTMNNWTIRTNMNAKLMFFHICISTDRTSPSLSSAAKTYVTTSLAH